MVRSTSPQAETATPASRVRRAIYAALFVGVVMFAAIVRFVVGPIGTYGEAPLRYVWLVAAAGCTLAAGFFKTKLAGRGADDAQRTSAAVVVWALAEGQALLGIVAYMLSGDVLVFWTSLILFAYLFARYRPGVFEVSPSRSPR